MQYTYDLKGVLTPAIFPEMPSVGILIPSNGVELEELEQKEGYIWIYQNGVPVQIKDNSGIYYLKGTGKIVEFTDYGDISDTLTKKALSSAFDK